MQTARVCRSVLCSFLLTAAASAAFAQSELPKAWSGGWTGVTERSQSPLNGTVAMAIDKQNPDGTVEGRMSFSGNQCAMKDEPMAGRLDGEVLTVQATFRALVPQASCGRTTFVLKRSGNRLEGEIPGSRLRIKVTLDPA